MQIAWVVEQSLITLMRLDMVTHRSFSDILNGQAEPTQGLGSKLRLTQSVPSRSLVQATVERGFG
ncbi:hypothetical protein [Agrobacterium pusense]|uniref:hypothetical protein n=1 Tax=Agrobacterium pusense TaxID=648995 RepID=UPI0030771351